jgi:hypothetical protein
MLFSPPEAGKMPYWIIGQRAGKLNVSATGGWKSGSPGILFANSPEE